MGKEKVTLDAGLRDARRIACTRWWKSLSASVDAPIAAHLGRLRHLAAMDDWLADLEQKHGPIPPETLDWAARIVERWAEPPKRRKKAG